MSKKDIMFAEIMLRWVKKKNKKINKKCKIKSELFMIAQNSLYQKMLLDPLTWPQFILFQSAKTTEIFTIIQISNI